MDEVKRLLEGFADRAAEGLPDADIDADVTRGRLALRRIKRRRRVAGVLCVAAASALVLSIGNQVKWWGNGNEVAGRPPEQETAATSATPATPATPATQPRTTPSSSQTMSMFGASVVELVANKQAWSAFDCTLAPKGWSPETPMTATRVVLSQPEMRTADSAAKVVLQAAPQARSLSKVRVTDASGKTFHIGTLDGRLTGQVKLSDQWLLVELPTGTVEWPDDVFRRFLDSCTVK
ncbi:hypothetical protein EV137_7443 [Kribbella pratensis]|uniref:Uncharacterized protein n=1 Tax=Kribbella pratensis TaxID=2512112 RepID=A0ABY2F4G7_9ACTN|nr:hypothetical protein [Kribbella pratensis]TDW81439.1 hypothetical protein EV137_7443 [Kribbella pratensis]